MIKKSRDRSGMISLALVLCALPLLVHGADDDDYKKDEDKIAQARQTRDFSALKSIGDDVHQSWRTKDKQRHADLMLKLCEPISSGIFGVNKGRDLARKYALSGLEDTRAISAETEAKLAEQVVTPTGPGTPTGDAWTEQRKQDAQVKLHAWQRLIDEIGPPLGPDDAYKVYIDPPAGSLPPGFPVPGRGVSPEVIKDPKLRAKYEADIAENNRKAAKTIRHHELEEQLKQYSRWAEKYIVDAYSKPPTNFDELDQSLKANIKDAAIRTRILSAVKKRTGAK